MCFLALYFGNFILAANFVYETVFVKSAAVESILTELSWGFIDIYLILAVVYVSTSIAREAQRTPNLIHKIINLQSHPEHLKQVRKLDYSQFVLVLNSTK